MKTAFHLRVNQVGSGVEEVALSSESLLRALDLAKAVFPQVAECQLPDDWDSDDAEFLKMKLDKVSYGKPGQEETWPVANNAVMTVWRTEE